jgi:[NiFe] hydrogenase small subunit
LGLDATFGPKIFEAFAAGPKPPVLWLHFAECTGCTEAVPRSSNPGFADLIFDTISRDYHETLMAAAGGKRFSVMVHGRQRLWLRVE